MTLWTSPLHPTGNLTPDQSASKLATIRATLSCLFCVRPDRRKLVTFILAGRLQTSTTQLLYSMSKLGYGRGLILKDESISFATQLEPISMTLVRQGFISAKYIRHILAFVTNVHVEHLTHIQPGHGLKEQMVGRRLSCRCGLWSFTWLLSNTVSLYKP